MHFGSAHTGGDTVVYFPNLRVVAVGDRYTPDAPEVDFAGGGSLMHWGPVLAEVLKLDFGVVAPSAGPTVTRADREAFKTRMDTSVARASAPVRSGVAKDPLMGKLKTDDLGWRFRLTPDPLDRLYAEWSQAK